MSGIILFSEYKKHQKNTYIKLMPKIQNSMVTYVWKVLADLPDSSFGEWRDHTRQHPAILRTMTGDW